MIGDKKFGFVREFRHDVPKGENNPFVPPAVIKKFGLRDGVTIVGTMRPGRKGAMQVRNVDTVMDIPAEMWARTEPFDKGTTSPPMALTAWRTCSYDLSELVEGELSPICGASVTGSSKSSENRRCSSSLIPSRPWAEGVC